MAASALLARVGAAPLVEEPSRMACPTCLEPVLIVLVGRKLVIADPWEYEPRASCYVCAGVRARGNARNNCDRCGGTGYVGESRPREMMLAVDIAWSDEGHVRLIGPNTDRVRGEALYRIHEHDHSVIIDRPNPMEVSAA